MLRDSFQMMPKSGDNLSQKQKRLPILTCHAPVYGKLYLANLSILTSPLRKSERMMPFKQQTLTCCTHFIWKHVGPAIGGRISGAVHAGEFRSRECAHSVISRDREGTVLTGEHVDGRRTSQGRSGVGILEAVSSGDPTATERGNMGETSESSSFWWEQWLCLVLVVDKDLCLPALLLV
jgi:hypothetical protein